LLASENQLFGSSRLLEKEPVFYYLCAKVHKGTINSMAAYSMFKSSIGRKFVMGLTGLFLITFLVVHVSVNACIYFNDGGQTFNKVAEFFGTNIFIRTMEIVLFALLILHILQSLALTRQNKTARPVEYVMNNGQANSKWYSRSMGLLGTLILIFLIIHLRHFWIISRFTDRITGGEETLFDEMKEVFSQLWVVILYAAAMVSLAYHLLHGFQSSFQTMGWNHPKYMPIIKKAGVLFSIIVPLVFASMPFAIYMGYIK
jgi:succinate dehydrogenase / fumarate reductase cytochrome b subunit